MVALQRDRRMTNASVALGAGAHESAREVIYRHTRATRVTHWVNLLCVWILLLSGFNIFNAHPELYWGQKGANADPAFVQIGSRGWGGGHPQGFVRIGDLEVPTTGVFGLSNQAGRPTGRAYPSWLTLPGYTTYLSAARRWHFFFAWLFVLNGLGYMAFGFANKHFKRDLLPTREELEPRHIWRDIVQHAQLKLPKGEAAKRYNILQKLSYLAVGFILLPTMVLTGLTMSPGMDAVAPFLLDLFGGRQSARTLHWITANLIVLFALVHVFMVFVAGAVNEIRSMVTGFYAIEPETDVEAHG
jgi:thiosulfate reductase cytochrome b subunit